MQVSIFRLEKDGQGPFHINFSDDKVHSRYDNLRAKLLQWAVGRLKEPHRDGIMVVGVRARFAVPAIQHFKQWLTPELLTELSQFGFEITEYKINPNDLIESRSGTQVMYYADDARKVKTWKGKSMHALLFG